MDDKGVIDFPGLTIRILQAGDGVVGVIQEMKCTLKFEVLALSPFCRDGFIRKQRRNHFLVAQHNGGKGEVRVKIPSHT